MNWASEKGHIEVIKYLHYIGKYCTTNAMNYASRKGHLEVVKYLHSIFTFDKERLYNKCYGQS